MFGRVSDYNTRSNLRATAPPSKNQNPFVLPGFEELDKLVSVDFLQSFPPEYKHLGVSDDGGALDTDLYMAHIVPHACVICYVWLWLADVVLKHIHGAARRSHYTTHTSTSPIPEMCPLADV